MKRVAEVRGRHGDGLGSGSTAAFALESLAERIAGGLCIVGIPTSKATATLARRLGIPLTTFDRNPRLVIAVDESKLVDRLGGRTALPVEIVPFGWQTTLDRLAALGCAPVLRLSGEQPVATDCAVPETPDPAALEARLLSVVGVIETGLFIGLACTADRRTPRSSSGECRRVLRAGRLLTQG